VLGMRRRGTYREIPVMLPRIFEFALRKNIQIAGYPIFLCHEITFEDVKQADKEEYADIEVAVWSLKLLNFRIMRKFGCVNFQEERLRKLFTRDLMKSAFPLMRNFFPGLRDKEKELLVPFVRYTLTILGKFRLKRY
jgi:hypothetical protein